jgi:hypothetical protein
VVQNTGTTWSYVDPASHPTSFTYQARVVDIAGNVGGTDSQAITIDTTAAAPTGLDLAAADDTGRAAPTTSPRTPPV